MLALSRKQYEAVIIHLPDGRRITVKVMMLRADQVRLGFDAPADVVIHREEIQQRIDAETSKGA